MAWDELLTHHFHHGAVINTPETFLLARRVNYADPDHVHLSALQWRADGDCWTIGIAVGRLAPLLELSRNHPTPWVSWCRNGSFRLRRVSTAELYRHALTETTETTSPGATTSLRHRPGKGRR